MEKLFFNTILNKAGIYATAYEKDTGKVVFISEVLAKYLKDAKLGDKYEDMMPRKHLFGDGNANEESLIYDPCDGGIWFKGYTEPITHEKKDYVLVYCIPTKAPEDILLVDKKVVE